MCTLNVWIHCRVTNQSDEFLLDYQKDKIIGFLEVMPVKIIGISKEVNSGTQSLTRALEALRLHIRKEQIHIVVVTDKTRLFTSENLYQEFILLCQMHHVELIDLKELDNLFQPSIFNE